MMRMNPFLHFVAPPPPPSSIRRKVPGIHITLQRSSLQGPLLPSSPMTPPVPPPLGMTSPPPSPPPPPYPDPMMEGVSQGLPTGLAPPSPPPSSWVPGLGRASDKRSNLTMWMLRWSMNEVPKSDCISFFLSPSFFPLSLSFFFFFFFI